ncbi:MAG TPA: class I SAM-dependent methyltransferase [Rubrivivax sp.]|nr:class I SAM-dependent methyltransferase [Rubrivivax sp.]
MSIRLRASALRWPGWPWPLPALLAWAGGWAAWALAGAAGAPLGAGWLAGLAASAALAWHCTGRWRQGIAVAGFPLSALALGLGNALPPWAWLLALLPLLLAYPLRAWRDAPFFPTPRGALHGLDGVVGTPRRVLDAGCGLGHGLVALRGLWPQAELHGVEWSLPLALAARWRCRWARVRRGDMWAGPWAGYDLVYVFQRPENMARVFDKARRELGPQGWLVSLEFPVPGQEPQACLQGPGRRPLWIYRAGAAAPGSIAGECGR